MKDNSRNNLKNLARPTRPKRFPVTEAELDKLYTGQEHHWGEFIQAFLEDMCTAWPLSKRDYQNLGNYVNKHHPAGIKIKTKRGKYFLFRVGSDWYRNHFPEDIHRQNVLKGDF